MRLSLGKKRDGFALSWAVALLLIASILTVFLLAAGAAYAQRSAHGYAQRRAYLTARSAVSAIAYELQQAEGASEAGVNPVFDSDLIPRAGETIDVTDFAFGGGNLGRVERASIERRADGSILVSATASSGERSETVRAVLQEQIVAGALSAPSMGFDGIYVEHKLEMGGNARLETREGGNVYLGGTANMNSNQTVLLAGNLYGSHLASILDVTEFVDGYTSYEEPAEQIITPDGLDLTGPFILLNDNNRSRREDYVIDLDALSDANGGGSTFLLVSSHDLRDVNDPTVGTADNDGGITESASTGTVTFEVNRSKTYFIYVAMGSTLNLNLNQTDETQTPQVFVIADGKDAFGGEIDGTDTKNGFLGPHSGQSTVTIGVPTGGPYLFLYGAKNTTFVIEDRNGSTVPINGAINCYNLTITDGLTLTRADTEALVQDYTHTFRLERYKVS